MIWTRLKISANDSPLPSSLFVEEISNLLVISGVETFTVEDFSDLKDTLSGGETFIVSLALASLLTALTVYVPLS